jgi:hypothetical protein
VSFSMLEEHIFFNNINKKICASLKKKIKKMINLELLVGSVYPQWTLGFSPPENG